MAKNSATTLIKSVAVVAVLFLLVMWVIGFANGQTITTIEGLLSSTNMDTLVHYIMLPWTSLSGMLTSSDGIMMLTGYTNLVAGIVFTAFIAWPYLDDMFGFDPYGRTRVTRKN